MFSLGFISYTISVVKAVLEANPELVEAAHNEAINSSPNSGGETGNPIADLDESQYAEIVNQTTTKVVQQLLESESQAVKEIISDQVSAMIIDEKAAADLQNAAIPKPESLDVTKNIPVFSNKEIATPKTTKKEPVIEYEDIVVTDYYLRYYFGGEDYNNLQQKLNWVDTDLKSGNDVKLKQKYQENLVRDKQDLLRWEEVRADMLKKVKNY
jgi:hypothetical protein